MPLQRVCDALPAGINRPRAQRWKLSANRVAFHRARALKLARRVSSMLRCALNDPIGELTRIGGSFGNVSIFGLITRETRKRRKHGRTVMIMLGCAGGA